MLTLDDMQLLEDYAAHRSEDAFTALVSRYINLVYSTAFRQIGNRQAAEEVTQAVFVILAKKANSLKKGVILSGWLYQTARLTAANYLRGEIRRQNREQEVYMQSTLNPSEPDPWAQVGPLLEQAMAGLSETDRNAIVLRFFENKQLKEVGAALGTTDDAAKMRVNRAVEKLRVFFLKRGITISATALATAISARSIEAAPAGLSTSVVAAACHGSAVTASTLTLAKGTLKLMAWTKLNIAVGVGAAAVIALQWNQIQTQKHEVARLQEQFEQASAQTVSQEATIKKLEERGDSLAAGYRNAVRESVKVAARAPAPKPAAAPPAPAAPEKSMGSLLSKMMDNPDTMKAMAEMQAQSVKLQYAAFVKQMNMTPEQRDAFYNLLVARTTNNLARGLAMLGGTNQADSMSSAATEQQSLDSDLKNLLGEGGFQQYTEYTSTIMDRTLLQQYQTSFTDNPLSADQQNRLLQLMKTERESLPAPAMNGNGNALMNSSDMLAQQMQYQADLNQRVLTQASNILSPDQLQTLGTAQSNMLSLQKMSMSMAQGLLGGASNSAAH